MTHSPQDKPLLPGEVDQDFVHYLRAIEILRDRFFDATPEEIAVWVFLGSTRGGLDTGKSGARVDAGWVDPGGLRAFLVPDTDGVRQRFRFSSESDSDYIAQLARCFFRPVDLRSFEPLDRYLSYQQLLQRWAELYKDQGVAESQICAEAANVEGLVVHPQTGTTSGSWPTVGWARLPLLETGMFSRRAVEEIEKGWGVTAAQSSDAPLNQPAEVLRQGSPDQAETGNQCDVFRAMENLDASEVGIAFVGDKGESSLAGNSMLEISARGEKRRIALAQLDLVDRRSGTLNRQAAVLMGMARSSNLPYSSRNSKMVARLRNVFRKHLGLRNDPFEPYRRGFGWQPRFKITDMRGAEDARAKREGELRTVPYDDDPLLKRNRTSDNGQHDSGDKGDPGDAWLRTNDPEAPA